MSLRWFLLLLSPLILLGLAVTARAAELSAGPMVGPVTAVDARIWVQTNGEVSVRLLYRPADGTGAEQTSAAVATKATENFTADLLATAVAPGTLYRYEIEVDGRRLSARGTQTFQTQPVFRERSQPPAFRVALAGAHYATEPALDIPYREHGGDYAVFNRIAAAAPDFVLWAGNSAILREPDLGSRHGFLRRYQHSRNTPELAELLQTRPHYAVWSRLDYGAALADQTATTRRWAEDAFNLYWPMPGNEGREVRRSGQYTQFRWADVDFFLLDVNSFRDGPLPMNRAPAFLGEVQMNWLRSALMASDAPFKVIVAGAPLLNPARTDGNYSAVRDEHNRFLQMLRESRVPGLFFVSGGGFYGEYTRFVQAGSYDLHELSVGPATATPVARSGDLNFFRQPGTYSESRQFALLEFSGPEEARVLTIRVKNASGEEIWTRSLTAEQVSPR